MMTQGPKNGGWLAGLNQLFRSRARHVADLSGSAPQAKPKLESIQSILSNTGRRDPTTPAD